MSSRGRKERRNSGSVRRTMLFDLRHHPRFLFSTLADVAGVPERWNIAVADALMSDDFTAARGLVKADVLDGDLKRACEHVWDVYAVVHAEAQAEAVS